MGAATTELVWGHGLLETVIDEHQVRYPLVATPVVIEYEPDQLTDHGVARRDRPGCRPMRCPGSTSATWASCWRWPDRPAPRGRPVERPGSPGAVRARDGPARLRPAGHRARATHEQVTGPHIVDTGVLFARPKQRQLRGFLESLRDRLLAGDTAQHRRARRDRRARAEQAADARRPAGGLAAGGRAAAHAAAHQRGPGVDRPPARRSTATSPCRARRAPARRTPSAT